jgi:hypothetical protein
MAKGIEKMTRVESSTEKLNDFLLAGGDLKSPNGAALSVEAVEAFAELARGAGYEILKPLKKKADFIRPDPAAR